MRVASGLHEALGLKVIGDEIYVTQKCELTRLRDLDGDRIADRFECVSAAWGFTGDYHDFTFGPLLDADGSFYLFRDGQRGRWEIPYMSWCVRVFATDPQRIEGVANGLRVPNGWAFYGDGPQRDIFVTDNQGNWIGACKLNHIKPGSFYGFPASQPAPREDYRTRTDFTPPAVWFPRKLAPSASGIAVIDTDRFGPFRGQMLVGDFQNSVVTRVALEKVGGEWQGAVFPFSKGYLSGVNRLLFAADGRLYVGGLKNKAWPAFGPLEQSLDRVVFTGTTPFEVVSAKAHTDGFELIFTLPVDASEASNVENYQVAQFSYEYHAAYGSAEFDHAGRPDSATELKVEKAEPSADGLRVSLKIAGLRVGNVTQIRMSVPARDGALLRQASLYYTLNRLPE